MEQIIKTRDLVVFALIWALIFFIIGIYPLFSNGNARIWGFGISTLLVVIAYVKPAFLKDIYNIWVKAGELIGGIVSKVIMFILYFGLFTLVAFVLKILGKDLLRKKMDKDSSTYWIQRETQPQSMKNQF